MIATRPGQTPDTSLGAAYHQPIQLRANGHELPPLPVHALIYVSIRHCFSPLPQ